MSANNDAFVGPPPRRVRGLSWGALVFTPFWLVRNGFWLTTILYVLCAIFVWPIAHIIAFLFFFLGIKWSWSKGQRWRSYEEFCSSRFTWDYLALLSLAVAVVVVALEAWEAR